jgi:hypothetical protein
VVVHALADQRALLVGREAARLQRRALGGQHPLGVDPFGEGLTDQAGQHGFEQCPPALGARRGVRLQ